MLPYSSTKPSQNCKPSQEEKRAPDCVWLGTGSYSGSWLLPNCTAECIHQAAQMLCPLHDYQQLNGNKDILSGQKGVNGQIESDSLSLTSVASFFM